MLPTSALLQLALLLVVLPFSRAANDGDGLSLRGRADSWGEGGGDDGDGLLGLVDATASTTTPPSAVAAIATSDITVVYSCSERHVEGNLGRCEELAVSLYSLATMLKPERSAVDARVIHVRVLANPGCGDCLSKLLTKMAKVLAGRVEVTVVPADSLPTAAAMPKKFTTPSAAMKALIAFALPDLDRLLIVDSDTVVTGDIRELWDEFGNFNAAQMLGVAGEQDSLYATKKVPWGVQGGHYTKGTYEFKFVPPFGINSGVVLVEADRVRASDYEDSMRVLIEEYGGKKKYGLGDQFMLNWYLHDHMEALYRLPCRWNIRTDSNCSAPGADAGIVHGNRRVFMSGMWKFWNDIWHHVSLLPFVDDTMEQKMRDRIRAIGPWIRDDPRGIGGPKTMWP